MLMAAHVPILTPMELMGHRITWATAVLLVYVVYYCQLDQNGGGAVFSIVLYVLYYVVLAAFVRGRCRGVL